ncbi:MAG: Calx-beta domain-containing protein, partial [Actinomycetota bacterium]
VATRGGSSGAEETLIVPRPVERRTLDDVLTVNGVLEREEIRKINSPVDGRVSDVFVDDGEEVVEGSSIFSLDGRAAVAVPGEFSFYRPLDVGSVGPDVLQLERILQGSGYSPGPVDSLFTEATRSALARWQIVHGYPGANPEGDESVTVSLVPNGSGYEIGAQNSIGFTIGPAVPAAARVGEPEATFVAARPLAPTPAKPEINIESIVPSKVKEGQTVTLTFTADPAPSSNLTVDINAGGDATGGDNSDNGDYKTIDANFVFPKGATEHKISTRVFVDDVLESDEDITVSLTDQFNNDPTYQVGPRNSVTATILADNVGVKPTITIRSATDVVQENGTATYVIESNYELGDDLDIGLAASGTATPDVDYQEIDDEVTLTAGNKTVNVTLAPRQDQRVESDETVSLRIVPRAAYRVGSPSSSTVRIESGNVPELTLQGGGFVGEGGAVAFTIVADAPVTQATSINYQLGGNANPGQDYEVLSGTAIMPAGASSVTVLLKTIADDVIFLPSDMIVADWPARIGTVEVDQGEFVLQGGVVLTLTEPRFTVKLKVSASDRAELKIGQETIVDLESSGQDSVPGIITQLDDTVTVADDKSQTYEGVVEVQEEPRGVDGASVSIDVTLARKENVIAVPVAAVLERGGKSEVRVISDAGRITRREVTVGLVDDDYVEITEGLEPGELVIVSVETNGSGGS